MTDKRRQAPDIFREIIADDQDGHFRWYLQQARGGDDSAARELLDGFCCAVQEGERIPAPILEHLLFGLIRYLDDGVPLEKALHLNKPANRPRGVVTVDPVRAVATIYLYMKRDGLTKGAALKQTCGVLGVSRRNLERLDAVWNLIRERTRDELETLVKPAVKSKRSAKK